MRVRIIALGNKMPAWVQQGFEEYAKRIPGHLVLEVKEIALNKRTKRSQLAKAQALEGKQMIAAIGLNDLVIALEVSGDRLSSEQLAAKLKDAMMYGVNLSILIGGPEGIPRLCSERVQRRWSLSALTLPHTLVRVILIEQIYRACSLLEGHPYHK